MPDVFTKSKRSEVMSRIRSRGNKETELAFATLLRKNHISGWRRHFPITGRPDFAFGRERVAVFIDGCFWHCCPRCGNVPENNRAFWVRKLSQNRRRDRLVSKLLKKNGWTVLRIWEHDLKRPDVILKRMRRALSR